MTGQSQRTMPSAKAPPSPQEVLWSMRSERRAKIALMSYPASLYYVFRSLEQSAWFTLIGLLSWFFIAFTSEYLDRRLKQQRRACLVFTSAFFALVGFAGLGDGLVNSPCLWLAPLGPVLGAVLLGIKAAYRCLGLSIALVLAIWAIDVSFDLKTQFVHSESSLYIFRMICLAQFSLFGWIWTRQLRIQVQKISDRNQVLEEAKDELEVAHQSKSSFLATMSHEIRTPMNGILGTAQCLAQGELQAEQRSWVQVIQDSGQYLMDVLNAILDLSKIDADKLKTRNVDLRLDRVFDDVMAEISQSLGAQQILLEYRGPDQPYLIKGDPDRIEQVLRSLVLTAIEWADNTQLKVELASQPDRPAITISLPQSGLDQSRMEILQDPGSALLKDTHVSNRIALGMKLCHALVALMDGEIEVLQDGSEITRIVWKLHPQLQLQLTELDDSELLIQTVELPQESFEHTVVLVADDNAINRKIAKTQLERLGCQIHTASNGTQAIERSQELRFDLILMDLNMPECDGFEAAQTIKNSAGPNQNTPIVAFTADAYDVDHQRLQEAGLCDRLAKPFRVEAVRRLLRRWSPSSKHLKQVS